MMYIFIKILTTTFALVCLTKLNGQYCNVYQTALDTTIIESVSPFYNFDDHKFNSDKQTRRILIYISPAIKDFDALDMNVWFLAKIGDSANIDSADYPSYSANCKLTAIDTNYILTSDFKYYETIRQQSDNFQLPLNGKYYFGITIMFSQLIVIDDFYYGYITRKLGPELKFYLFKLQKTKSGISVVNVVSISDS